MLKPASGRHVHRLPFILWPCRWIPLLTELENLFRACLETTRGAAARDFGCGQGAVAARSAPQRAVRNESTPATDKRPAARRVFGEKAVWLRPARECLRSCSVVAARSASFVVPRHPGFSPKTAPLVVSKQALSARQKAAVFALLKHGLFRGAN